MLRRHIVSLFGRYQNNIQHDNDQAHTIRVSMGFLNRNNMQMFKSCIKYTGMEYQKSILLYLCPVCSFVRNINDSKS